MADRILSVRFEQRYASHVLVAARLALDFARGPVACLFGPSGAGKTSVLRCLAGLDRPSAGRIEFDGRVWFDAAERTWVGPQARQVGYLPQGFALFPHLSVAGNIGYGVDGGGALRRARVSEVVELLGLGGLEERRPHELSGGQRQRVALGRALARRPQLFLLDEPLSALDMPTREELRTELRRLLIELAVPTVMVTHDRSEALTMADQLALMIDGRVRQVGAVDEVFARPADADVARIVGADVVGRGRVVAAGDGLAEVDIGGRRLLAVADAQIGAEVQVTVRPEEVMIIAGDAGGQLSAQNRLAARVVAIGSLGPLIRLELDCGFRLRALITRPAREGLGIHLGAEVTAVVKATAVHLL